MKTVPASLLDRAQLPMSELVSNSGRRLGEDPMSEVHVIPDDRTTWRVFDAGAREAVSEHTNATDAELAAQEHGADRVVVHDRYHRTHDAPISLVGSRARAMRARAGRTRRCSRTGPATPPRQLPPPAITAATAAQRCQPTSPARIPTPRPPSCAGTP